MTIYLTSDCHFGHDRDFIWGPRGFSSLEEHDRTIVENWNSIVTPQDTVYILGDLMLGTNHEYGLNCLKALQGEKYFIAGNHDTLRRQEEYQEIRLAGLGLAHILNAEGYRFYLCHYKTETSRIDNMAPLKNHLINLHGHTHSKAKFESDNPFQYNVALDCHNNYPVPLGVVINDINQKCEECLSFL